MKKINTDRLKKRALTAVSLIIPLSSSLFMSCEDFFEQDSDSVVFADKAHLDNAADTIYNVIGIMRKLQTIADRTVILGEVRADLVDINDNTKSDLRDIALFNVNDSNEYNAPKDYYSVINNCNFYIAKADTALKNNRNEYIFRKEYAAVKAFRAWTYLQLALIYGRVPFVTDPILTEEEIDEESYPQYDIEQICEYFINDLTGWETMDMPSYGTVGSLDSRLLYYPIYVLLGDLNLWVGNYKAAALDYYMYISTRNGDNSAYPTMTFDEEWQEGTTTYIRPTGSYVSSITDDGSYYPNQELIFMIPGDSIPAYGYYSELKDLYNSDLTDYDYEVSLTPSEALIDLSESQDYCQRTTAGEALIVPHGLEDNYDGDLRLSAYWNSGTVTYKKQQVEYQKISKFNNGHVHILRRATVYLRMAEALNRAGYPRMAFEILRTGLNNRVIEQNVIPYYPADSTWIRQFDFPNTQYILRASTGESGNNQMGIHGRGSGWAEISPSYVMPDDTTLTDDARLDYQIEAVEDLIIDEDALETALEGGRFYDLMRVALRRGDPAFLADRVYARRGADKSAEMQSLIGKDLYTTSNWYLSWKGVIGY